MQNKVFVLQLNNVKSESHEWGLRLLQFGLEYNRKTIADESDAERVVPAAGDEKEDTQWIFVSGDELRNVFAGELELGAKGKPYLREEDCGAPLYFNISHSGSYVVCAISKREVGVDIQEHKSLDYMKTAQRFFAKEEKRVLKDAQPQEGLELFYRLWTRKEAYGKMLGEGVAPVLSENMLECENGEFCMDEYSHIPGYSLAVCKSRNQKK